MLELLSFDASETRSIEVSQFIVKNPSLSSVSYAGQLDEAGLVYYVNIMV